MPAGCRRSQVENVAPPSRRQCGQDAGAPKWRMWGRCPGGNLRAGCPRSHRRSQMETEVVKRPTTSAPAVLTANAVAMSAARRHRIRNSGRTNRVCHSKTKSYKKGLMIDPSRIWRRAQAAEEMGAHGSEFRGERAALEAKSEPSRLRDTQMVRIAGTMLDRSRAAGRGARSQDRPQPPSAGGYAAAPAGSGAAGGLKRGARRRAEWGGSARQNPLKGGKAAKNIFRNKANKAF